MQLSGQPNDFVDPAELQALSKLRSETGPIFSLYLDLRTEKQVVEDASDRFERMLREMEQQKKVDQDPPEYQEHWRQDAEQIRQWLEAEQPLTGEGLVIFSSHAENLWRVHRLPVAVEDRLVVTMQAHTRPLEVLMGEFSCTLVALIDAGDARLVEVILGRGQELLNEAEFVPVTGATLEEGLRQHARWVTDQVEAAWRNGNCNRLIIGGGQGMAGELRDSLPEPLYARLAGEIDLPPRAAMDDILAEVLEIESELERDLEAQRVEELMVNSGIAGRAVFGMDQTMLAVRSKKVRLLVVEEDFHQAGGECPNCGFLEDTPADVNNACILCGVGLRPETDIVEVALQRVLEADGQIEVLRSPQSRRALESYGRIGALIDEAEAVPPEKNAANQATIASEGEIHHDVLHDEKIEDSFPASDPPGGY